MATKEQRKIIGVGGSKAVSIPIAWADYHNVEIGDAVEVITKNKTMIINLMDKIEGEEKNGSNGCNKNGELQDQC